MVCLVGLKNLLCNPEEVVGHVKKKEFSIICYRDHFFFLLHHSKSEHLLFLVILLRCLAHSSIHYTT